MSADRDNRGQYGFGRMAHGSDPNARYGFGTPQALTPLQMTAEIIARCSETTEARVVVRDLDFIDDESFRAEVSVFVASGVDAFDVTLNLPIERQGNVDEALDAAKTRLIEIFRAAIADLETTPLRRG